MQFYHDEIESVRTSEFAVILRTVSPLHNEQHVLFIVKNRSLLRVHTCIDIIKSITFNFVKFNQSQLICVHIT